MKLICLLPLLFGSGLFANSYSHHDAGLEHFGMVQYGRADGLACSRVFCAMQDDLGYVWLGTEYGVTRYDGEQFENFSLREGVGDHAIINIEADSRGILWFLSAAGELSCYFEGQFFNAENSEVMRAASGKTFLFSTCELPDGSLWITTDKDHPVRISPDGRVNRAPKFTHIVRHGHPRLIFPEPDGRLTAVDAWGIFDFNAPDSNYTFVFDMEQPKFAGRYTQMEPGEYLIADVDNRIHHLKDHKVSPWFAPAENPIDALIVQLQRLADGSVWVGTFDGAWCLREGKIVGRVLEGYSVSDILQDSEGNIWFTTHHNGVFLMPALNFRRFPIPQPHLKPQSVTAIHSDPDGSVYFGGTGSDVWHLQGDGVLNDLIDLPATKMERGVSRICRMDEELVLIGSKAGLLIEWKGQRRFVRVGGIRALEVLSDGRVMMAVGKKLCLMDRREILALWEEWDQKPGPNLYDIKAALVMRHRVAKGRFHALLELGPDSILVSLDGGLQLWHAGKLRAAPRGLQGIQSKAIGMLKAGPSEYWIATRGKGLLRYRSGKLDVFDETNGLLSNHCTALAQDRFGNIWLATLSGLNLLPNGKRSAIRSFTVANGLPSDEIHALAFRGDSLILGTQSGPCWMRGRELEAFLTPPRFFLTDVEIDGRPTPIRQLTALDAPRNLKFAFKAISYRHQAALKYRYTSSLDSTEWYALSENEFVVHNPGPGAHFIQAQVSLDGERWSPPLRHTFAVTHPTTQYWLWIPFSAALLVGLYLFRTARRQVRAAKAAAQAAAIPNFEFRHEGKRYALPITDILFFKAAGDYVEIVTTHQTWLIRSTMKRLQADTCQFPSFQRVHRSYLVNLAGVEAHDRKELVIGGQVVPVSRAYQGVVWEELSN